MLGPLIFSNPPPTTAKSRPPQALEAELQALEQSRDDAVPSEMEFDPLGTVDESDVEGMDDGELQIVLESASWCVKSFPLFQCFFYLGNLR